MKAPMVISVVLAIATSLVAWWPDSEAEAPTADVSAQTFNRGDKEVAPEQVASLEVSSWDAVAKAPEKFQVAKKGSKWVIPSHHDYPADGGTRVGKTAGSVLSIRRGPLVTDDPTRHAEFGLVDPLAAGTAEAEARGKRVTLKDAGGAALVDLIIGQKAEHAAVHYVRDAGEDAVFTAAVNADIRTAFKEWVETDLLKIGEHEIRSLTVDDHSVDEERGVVEQRGHVVLDRPKDAEEWTSQSTPEGKELDPEVISTLVGEITGLRLAGVRPYSSLWLQSRGFYPLKDGTLRGNEGAINISTRDGLVYHLFFGEIALGDAEDTSAEAASTDTPREGHNRYMAVFVRYYPERDEDRPEAKEGEETDATASAGAQKALEKEERFQTFFYVIDDESFGKLKPKIDSLWKDPEPDEDGDTGDESADGAGIETGDGSGGGDAAGEDGSDEDGSDDKSDDDKSDDNESDDSGSDGDADGSDDESAGKQPGADDPVPTPTPTPAPPGSDPK